jgi:hypothetical protein
MPSTGTVEIDGKQYTWESPTLADLEHFETSVGPLIGDKSVVDTIKGRVALVSLILRKHHPELLPGIVRGWSVETLLQAWPAVLEALPFWGAVAVPRPTASPSLSPSPSAGPPMSSEGSESPT